jgi:hypothetical protein
MDKGRDRGERGERGEREKGEKTDREREKEKERDKIEKEKERDRMAERERERDRERSEMGEGKERTKEKEKVSKISIKDTLSTPDYFISGLLTINDRFQHSFFDVKVFFHLFSMSISRSLSLMFFF